MAAKASGCIHNSQHWVTWTTIYFTIPTTTKTNTMYPLVLLCEWVPHKIATAVEKRRIGSRQTAHVHQFWRPKTQSRAVLVFWLSITSSHKSKPIQPQQMYKEFGCVTAGYYAKSGYNAITSSAKNNLLDEIVHKPTPLQINQFDIWEIGCMTRPSSFRCALCPFR